MRIEKDPVTGEQIYLPDNQPDVASVVSFSRPLIYSPSYPVATWTTGGRTLSIEVTTTLNLAPAQIVVERWNTAPAENPFLAFEVEVGDRILVDIGGKQISAIVRRRSIKYLGTIEGQRVYHCTYELSDEPADWSQNVEVNIWEPSGITIQEIGEFIAAIISPWNIWVPGVAAGKLISRWERTDISIYDVISEFSDMIGFLPILNHESKRVEFINLANVVSISGLKEGENIYSCSYSERFIVQRKGIKIRGITNEPLLERFKSDAISIPGDKWCIQMIDSTDKAVDSSTVGVAELTANITVPFAEWEWLSLSSVQVSGQQNVIATVGEAELTDWDLNSQPEGGEFFVKLSDNSLHEVDIVGHFMISVPVTTSDAGFLVQVEKKARLWLSRLVFLLSGNIRTTGQEFEVTAGDEPYDFYLWYMAPDVECAERLAEKLAWESWKWQELNLEIEGVYFAGQDFEGEGIIERSTVRWHSRSDHITSQIEVVS